MEALAWLFNSDFEKKLFSTTFHKKESSKQNQEFEYFIHLLNPEDVIFTGKDYSKEYKTRIKNLTQKDFKITNQAQKISNWCQEYNEVELLKKLQSKYETYKFLQKENLLKHEAIFVNQESELEAGYLYKTENGFSGTGHFLFPQDKDKIRKYLQDHGIILKEKLRQRDLDFSSLIINKEIICQYENYIDERFQYKGSSFSSQPFLNQKDQTELDLALVKVLDYLGEYRGVLSIDAFKAGHDLIPICEFNARKTMGYVAYSIWKKYFNDFSEFKFLLFKNNRSQKSFDQLKEHNIHLLSPFENNFFVFALSAHDKNEMKRTEKILATTLL